MDHFVSFFQVLLDGWSSWWEASMRVTEREAILKALTQEKSVLIKENERIKENEQLRIERRRDEAQAVELRWGATQEVMEGAGEVGGVTGVRGAFLGGFEEETCRSNSTSFDDLIADSQLVRGRLEEVVMLDDNGEG
jgi:hypothetical protein